MTEHSKPIPKNQQNYKTTEELILDFCQDLEKGDIALSKVIQRGYLLYGQTRSGKTANSHLLSGNPLKGVKIQGDQKVQTVTSKNSNNKIGNTMNSQTTVPNFFEIKDLKNPQKKSFIIDTPGYGDTKGPFKILGNGYYHYKLYSKVKNMKFIICFDAIQLQNTAELFIDTIVQFTSYFKDYKENRHKIWDSCVFLINKVDQNSMSHEDFKQKLKQIQSQIKLQIKKEQIDLIKQFICHIVENDKLFLIKKYKPGQAASRNQLLKEIDSKITWWSREMDPKKQEEVNMDLISFNLTKPILVELNKSDFSKQQYECLVKYYNTKIKLLLEPFNGSNQNIGSLDYVLSQLTKDAMGDPDSHQFLKTMKDYVDQNYKIFDPTFNEKRQKLQKQLFDPIDQNAVFDMAATMSNKKQKNKDKNYIVKKFQFLENVQKIRIQTVGKINDLKKNTKISKMDILDIFMKQLLNIIRQFKNVSYKRANCQEIVYKYGYLIYRQLNEAKVLLLLVEGASQAENSLSNKIADMTSQKTFSIQTPLKNFFDYINYFYKDSAMPYDLLLQQYIKNVDLQNPKFKKVQINWSLVDLFTSTQTNTDQVIMQKVILLLQKFSEQYLAERQTKQQNLQDVYKLIQNLTTARVNSHQLFVSTQDQNQKFQYFFLIKRITKNIGSLLLSIKKYSLARKVYNSIMFIDSVCTLYQEEIEEINKALKQSKGRNSSAFSIRIEYGKYLMQNGRQNHATKIFQQAFELASDLQQLSIVKQLLNNLLLQKGNDGTKSAYQQNMFQGNFLERFEEQLINELQNIGTNCMPQSQIMAD